MSGRLFRAMLSVCCLLAAAAVVYAQTATTGQVAGVVTDPSGSVVPGANVTLEGATGEKREQATGPDGQYRFTLIPPGVYKLSVTAAGFQTATVDAVGVKITETAQVDVPLAVAGETQAVTVTSSAPLVQTTSASTGRVIEETQVTQIPLPTRNFQQLLGLSTGTVASLSNNTEMGRGDATVFVNGQRGTSNNVLLDGVEINSAGTNSTPNISVPAPDAIEQFIVQTSLYDASQGRNSGGNVAVVTKSGTNQFHGDVYEYFRNDKLNANDFFLNAAGRPRPVLKRNQFGGTLGGPIIKEKTFFFFSYQGTRERNGASLTNSLTFPLIPAGLTSDRSGAALSSLASAFGVANPSPIALAMLQAKLPNGQYAIPSAASNSLAGNASTAVIPVLSPLSTVSRFREDQIAISVDHNVTANNRLSGKFFLSNAPQYQALFSFFGSNPFQLPGYGGDIDFHNRVATIADTHVFTPSLLNQFRVGVSRINGPSSPEEPLTNSQFGISNPLAATYPGLATIQVLGLFSLGSTTLADQKSTVETYTLSDMVSWNHGAHAVKIGGEARYYRVNFFFNFFSRGQINFNSFKDFLSGNIALGLLGNGVRDRAFRAADSAFFVQDDYKVNRKLALNFGLRFGRNGGISDTRGRLVNFDFSQFYSSAKGCAVATPCNPPNGFQILKPGETLNPNDWYTAPRFGFAYQPATKRNLVIRGGAGLYFDRFSTRVANLQVFNYPFDVVGVGLGSFAYPFPNLSTTTFPVSPASIPSPIPFYYAGVPLPTYSTPISGIYVDPNFRTPYVLQYNLGVQWEAVKNWMVEIGYVGSKGTKLINTYTVNQGAAPTLFTQYGFSNNKVLNGFQIAQTSGDSHYDSLQASLTKRLSNGLQFLASYTFSKSIDDGSGAPTNEFAGLPGDQQSRASQRAVSDFDRPHRFVLSGLYDLPKLYGGNSAAMKRVANGWELSGILTLQSGAPFSVVCVAGSALYNRADYLGGNANVGGSVEDRLNGYFNTAAFAPSCVNAAPYGTSGRNILRGPGQKDVDLGVIKFIPIREKARLEFRSEFFNIFNNVNFANPNNNVVVPGTLAKITATAAGPRVIQFALKLAF